MIDFETLSPDAHAIVLLCTSLGEIESGSRVRPLGPVAYSDLAERLRRQSFQGPRDLIGLDADAISRSLGIPLDAAADLERRLDRAGRIGFEFDRLRSNGVWFVTIADESYPEDSIPSMLTSRDLLDMTVPTRVAEAEPGYGQQRLFDGS